MSEILRVFDFAYHQANHKPLDKCFNTKVNGKWESLSSQQYINKANALSRGLVKLGIKAGDKVALISHNNRTEWHIADIGISQIGAINVPVYPTISEEDYEYILNHAEVKACIVSNEELAVKINHVLDKIPSLENVYCFEHVDVVKKWSELFDLGADMSLQNEVDARKESIKTTDLATIIYTSGTTGRPKGVMLSHQNIVQNVLNSMDRIPQGVKSCLSFLPICHVFERMLLYLYQYNSFEIYFAEGIDKISDNLKEVKPEMMSVVPRLLEKVYDKIVLKGSELTGIKKSLFFWAISVAEEYKPYQKKSSFYNFKLKMARKLIFSKWQEALGGNIIVLVSGSAALQSRLNTIFNAAGMPILEGYGLTETSPVISVNALNKEGLKIGTVGKMLNNANVKIANDGEILVKGTSVMMGYYKNPEKTAEVINPEGYFHTGDIGEIDSDRFLKITDRKKEMFKTSGGKYVAPQVLETNIKASRFVEQIMVVGEGEKMPCALIQPDFEFVKKWAELKHIKIGDDLESICKNPKLIKRILKDVNHFNKSLGKWEQIKKIELTPVVWSIENELLTPTMKLKRKQIKAKFIDLHNKMYEK